ncbi:MAG: hypothetical protein A3G34_06295 [Candidatus Lindowbacteria bacterium RIFCSPLOWO2_12_FULL_62_27]|nr:MAG: hypothetical protein A3G34_06295 [Candidatus Lindowbacteria bacterium RIFCSPLOWO2_12_FULL_62_27]OGH58775.1 MAG: hypothetical protein A3I06_09685 [Candidatus Lindowbacteria bacterium RIFCSPLOWO2_02_FULL_62_12]
MFPHIGFGELAIILVIILIIFGPSQLPKLAKMIGDSIRSLKKASSGEDDAPKPPEGRNGKA